MKRIVLTICLVLGVMVFFGTEAEAQWYPYYGYSEAASIIWASGDAAAKVGSVWVAHRQYNRAIQIYEREITIRDEKIKELQKDNARLEKRVKDLEERLDRLEKARKKKDP